MAKNKNSVRKNGYRSIFENNLAKHIENEGVGFAYEEMKIEYEIPARIAKYTPDFVLENGIVLEAKGLFEAEDRFKHALIKEQEPDFDIRFVFYDAKKTISKNSKTTYGDWCDHHGILWCDQKDRKTLESWYKEKKGHSYEYIKKRGLKNEKNKK